MYNIEVNHNFLRIMNNHDPSSMKAVRDYLTKSEKSFKRIGRGKSIEVEEKMRFYEEDQEGNLVCFRGIEKYLPETSFSVINDDTHDLITDCSSLTNHEIEKILQPESGFDLRADQIVATRKALQELRGILQLSTGAGKTEIMCAILKVLSKLNGYVPRTLIVEPTLILASGTARRLNKYGIKASVYSDDRIINEEVTITHPKSLLSMLETDSDLLADTKVFFSDECLPHSARILLPGGKEATIGEIYENEKITHVMSFNYEKNIYEPKRIVHRFRNEATEMFWGVYYEDPITGEIEHLTATRNHRVWTRNRGYVQVQDLVPGDELKIDTSTKTRLYRCSYCGKDFEFSSSLGGHINMNHINPDSRNLVANWTKEHGYQPHDEETWRNAMEKRSQNEEWKRKLSETKLGNLNPSKRPEVRAKISKSINERRRTNLEYRNKCIKNWRLAPIRRKGISGMTCLEKFVDDLNLPGLSYTGDGDYIIDFPSGKHKNPDFVYRNGDEIKIIEVGDIEYWHTLEEIDDVVEQYRVAGYECLYLTSGDIYDNPEETIGRIKKFLYNHHVKVIRIRKNIGKMPTYRYNIEVEDNHNYFADNVLVSNCQHQQSASWMKLLHSAPNLEMVIGLSALVVDEYKVDKRDFQMLSTQEGLIVSAIGPVLLHLSASFYISKGILATPLLFTINHKADEEIPADEIYDYQSAKEYRLHSSRRVMRVTICAEFFMRLKRKSLILVKEKSNALNMLKEFIGTPYESLVAISFGGGEYYTIQDREVKKVKKGSCDIMKLYEEGRILTLIGTSHLDEGVDIPSLDVVIIGGGLKKDRRIIQETGRVLRITKTGKYAVIIDFNDEGDVILHNQYEIRMRYYKYLVGVPEENIYENISYEEMKLIYLNREDIIL